MHRIAALVLIAFAGVPAAGAGGHSHATAKTLAPCNVIVVDTFTIDKNPATSDAPAGLDSMIHARAVQQLQTKAIFNDVIDAAPPAASQDSARVDARVDLRVSAAQPVMTGVPGAQPRDSTVSERRVILSGTVLSSVKAIERRAT